MYFELNIIIIVICNCSCQFVFFMFDFRFYFAVESCATLLTRDLKRNLFNLFATWCGSFSKPLGIASQIGQSVEEEKLQFSALQVRFLKSLTIKRLLTHLLISIYVFIFQAMSALLCCGHVFYTPYLSDDGIIYKWLDMLLTSKDEKVRVY